MNSKPKEQPIIISHPEMIRAILDGRKTQDRRPFKSQLPEGYKFVEMTTNLGYQASVGFLWAGFDYEDNNDPIYYKCPYGRPGDILWVKEKHKLRATEDGWQVMYPDGKIVLTDCDVDPWTDETWMEDFEVQKWRSPIYMPKWASRIKLEITDVRVERVQDIPIKDILTEGVGHIVDEIQFDTEYKTWLQNEFKKLWNSIYTKKGFDWETNCWVWVIEFRRTDPWFRKLAEIC